ncbi:DEAD/DEAH box helicase [Alkalitalea saponilacus]|uniref:Superfamily II DNA or RNA helicase, SNF2 family n=1 Tax=Alkalitalea saponilacus TaxID=889453 RepID=A0A1T5DGX6_9BACT|nr:DEAD/DEAH box helicase [Alkalitalea saponilacus]ASB50691.1 SNF family helicase [Alkalitalea saponilacus]SKB70740.1 Superfamily II DNA or RNA helicase, SNF2 family [Alkalitalea saponilacus]
MEQLIVVFTEKRNIGLTAIPYIATLNNNEPITLHEHATMLHVEESSDKFSSQEKEIISLLSKISDQALRKKFSPQQNLKDFIDHLPQHRFYNTLIKDHIDKILYQAIVLLSKGTTKAYFKNEGYSHLYTSDILKIPNCAAQPVFTFDLTSEGLIYTLKVKQCGNDENIKEFSLLNREVEFICHQSAAIKIQNDIWYFDGIDSNKFKPFITKSTITVPLRQIEPYMEGFVRNMVRNFDVTAKGFEIITTKEEPVPHLTIEKDLKHFPVIALHFRYSNRTFLADRQSGIFVDLKNDDGRFTFTKLERDFDYEQRYVNELTKLELLKSGEALFKPADAHCNDDSSEVLSLITNWFIKNRKRLDELNFSFDSGYEGREIFVGKVSLTIDTNEDNDWFEIKARVQIGEYLISFYKFRKNLLENNPEYILPNGQLFMIPVEWFTRFSELFNYAKSDKEVIRLPRAHFQILEQVKHGVSNLENAPQQPLVIGETELPKGIEAKLRPYQIEGYAWLNFLRENGFGGILADDMGLGKTLQTITMIQKVYQNEERNPEEAEHEEVNKQLDDSSSHKVPQQLSMFDPPPNPVFNKSGLSASLIVMPTSLVHNWQNEFNKFAPSLKIYNYTGTNRLRSKEIGKIFRHYHIVLTSYGVLRNDVEMLKLYRFNYFILDESQYVKNPTSKVYEAVKEIEASHRLTLTGTPIENSLVDLWAQMNLVNKGLLGSLAFFKRHFIQPITKQNNEEKEIKLQRLIQPFLLRRTKEKVAKDLPPVMEQVLYCDMTPEQERFYEKEKSGIRNSIYKVFEQKTPDQSAIMALQALTRLRQIANHPVMVDDTYQGSSGKFEQIIDNLESIVAEGHNVLVFSSFVKDLELLEKELVSRKLRYAKLTGATREREKVINEFNTKASIFLISLKAGGVGLNLTKADYVFMLNPWWNPAAEAQAINRAHRIGQTRNVFVYRFLSSGTIEEKIARLQEKKMQLADMFVNNNNPLTDLSKEEIMELFS